jgi:hypothetical protein
MQHLAPHGLMAHGSPWSIRSRNIALTIIVGHYHRLPQYDMSATSRDPKSVDAQPASALVGRSCHVSSWICSR